MDLLQQQRELAPNIVTCLKAVAQLLNQPQSVCYCFRLIRLSSPLLMKNDADF